MRAKLGPGLFGWSLLLLLGVSSCKNHVATSPQSEKSAQAVAQVPTQPRIESVQEKSCREFVRSFYDWYFDRLNAAKTRQIAGPSDYDVLTLKPQLFTPELRKKLHEDAVEASRNPGEIVGLDFDPFINAQDWEGKYWVNSVYLIDSTCRASVWGMDAGKKVDIVHPVLKITNGNWIFVDFFYPQETGRVDASLMGILTDLHNERERTTDKNAHK